MLDGNREAAKLAAGGKETVRQRETEMKRRAAMIRVVGIVSVAVAVAVAWRAWNGSYEQLTKAPCAYYQGNCTFIVAVPIGHFRLIP
jgi:hypothetical protein